MVDTMADEQKYHSFVANHIDDCAQRYRRGAFCFANCYLLLVQVPHHLPEPVSVLVAVISKKAFRHHKKEYNKDVSLYLEALPEALTKIRIMRSLYQHILQCAIGSC